MKRPYQIMKFNKWLIIAMLIAASLSCPAKSRSYGMVKHHRHVSIQNRVKYLKRQHQNRIFQSYLRLPMDGKGKIAQTFAPRGQFGLKKGWF